MAIGTTAAILGSAALGAAGSAYAAKKAAKSARRGAELTAAGEERALEYLQEREALPIALRDAALAGIGEQYGITLDEEGNVIREDMDLIERAKMDPLYQAELEAGEQAIARAATATGRLRGGATPADLARSGQEALGRSYGRQQSGLAG
ncbi:hypothetical protein KAR91_84685, partial [Candidatus Pacearchaeota archaeon]|nr:hypothetical protein [Candidatus Pacearchaeota archaeon]